MLRFTRRWHDAANSPLHGEARLLFVTPRTVQAPEWGPELPAAAPGALPGVPAGTTATRASISTLLSTSPMGEANAVIDALVRDIQMVQGRTTGLQNELQTKQLRDRVTGEFTTRVIQPLEQTIAERTAEQRALSSVLAAASDINARLTINDPPKVTLANLRATMQELLTQLRTAGQSTAAVEGFLQRVSDAERWVSSTSGSTDPDNPDVFDDALWATLTPAQREAAFARMQEIVQVPAIIDDVRTEARLAYDEIRASDTMEKLREFYDLIPVLESEKEAEEAAAEEDKSVPSVNQVRDKVNKLSTKLVLMSEALSAMSDDVARGNNEQAVNAVEGMRKAGFTWDGVRDYVDKKLSYTQEAQRRLGYIERFETLEDTQIPPLRTLDMMRTDVEREQQNRRDKNEHPDRVGMLDDELRAIDRTRDALLRRDAGLPDVSTDAAWGALAPAERQQVIDFVRDNLGIDTYLMSTMALAKNINERIETDENKVSVKLTKRVQEVQNTLGEEQGKLPPWDEQASIFGMLKNARGTWEQMKQTLGIEFYTPMQLWMVGSPGTELEFAL